MSCFPRGMELTEIPGASSAVPLAGGGIVRWNLPLSVPRQSITVVWQSTAIQAWLPWQTDRPLHTAVSGLLAPCRSPLCSTKKNPRVFFCQQ